MHEKLYFIFTLLFCSFCAAEAIAGPEAKVQVAHARDNWLAAFKFKNVDQAISFYTSDAVFLQPSGDRIEGIEAIHELYKKVANTFDSDLLLKNRNLEVSADLAFEIVPLPKAKQKGGTLGEWIEEQPNADDPSTCGYGIDRTQRGHWNRPAKLTER